MTVPGSLIETPKVPESLIEALKVEPVTVQEPLTLADLVLPEGFTSAPEQQAAFLEIMNGDMPSKERASALIKLQTEVLTAASEANSAEWDKLQQTWRDAVKTQLGEKYQPTLASVNKLVTEYGSPDLVEAFALTGAGNNPAVINFLAKVAEKLTEGTFVLGSPPAGESTAASRMFPSMKA